MKVCRNSICFNTNNENEEFWAKFSDGTWEEETIRILDDHLKSDDVMVDIGAWIGPISLYSSQKVKQCYSFEPDPIAFKNFSESILLNSDAIINIKPFNKAITTNGKNIKLFSRYTHGDSGSSILRRVKSTNKYYQVESTTFSKFIEDEKIEKIDFIKMDIEGGEFFILPFMKDEIEKFKPTILISFHYAVLVEYYEQKLFPLGLLRKLYRFIDSKKLFVKKKVNRKMIEVIASLGCENISDVQGNKQNISELENIDLSTIDMLLFKWN